MTENAVLPDPDDDETVIVGADESTLIVRRTAVPDDLDESTISVRDTGAALPDDLDASTISVRDSGAGSADDLDESTVSVRDSGTAHSDDAADADDSTVIVAADSVDDSTVIVRESAAEAEPAVADEATVRLDRSGPPAVRSAMTPRPGRRRGELKPAPVPSGFGGVPLVAAGPGAVSTYEARTLAPPSPALVAPAVIPAPDRALDRPVSVRAQSRSIAFWTLGAAAASVVLIGGGVWWALRDLVGF